MATKSIEIPDTIEVKHPLDPLTPDELEQVIAIVRRETSIDERALFETVMLQEPDKSVVRAFRDSQAIRRDAFVAVQDRTAGKVFEGRVSLDDDRLVSWEYLPGVQTRIINEELEEMAALVKVHPDFIEGLRKRGITDLDKVNVENMTQGNFGTEEEATRRLMRAHAFYVETPGDNPHVRAIDGLVPVVDLNEMTVLRVEDFGVKPIPPETGNYQSESQEQLRAAPARLDITQPDGPGFQVDGQLVTWENWSFRVGFTPREGMVLHTIGYRDGENDRPIIYRASLTELVVPYAETANDYFRNHSFDLGETVFGTCVNALTLGCDCLGEIHYLDVHMANGRGEVVRYPNAICMHEEDYGVLWKHTNPITHQTVVRRSRRMVVSSFYTVGNYDYGIFWYFYQDGTIEFEAKLTGILYCGAVEDGQPTAYGRMVAPNVNGMIHEHYFNVRLDMEVDGPDNAVVEVETDLVPTGPDNPHGNAHGARETLLESETQAARDIKPELGRYWKVINRGRTNRMGGHTAYKLMPEANIKPMHQLGSPFMNRAGFVEHDLWVTRYAEGEDFPCGSYVSQSLGGDGLPKWARADRSLKDEDLVLWYTMGVFHVPRLEDFPIMPMEYTGFKLKPLGFFDCNPALDLPPPHNK
ncbi:MAG: primary-amine oxidase [Rhodospirillaceae bacterium]|jgi:primary-amine oxidase|nr:primary-amine oxidase [Rhodospirillaceae bacterium]